MTVNSSEGVPLSVQLRFPNARKPAFVSADKLARGVICPGSRDAGAPTFGNARRLASTPAVPLGECVGGPAVGGPTLRRAAPRLGHRTPAGK